MSLYTYSVTTTTLHTIEATDINEAEVLLRAELWGDRVERVELISIIESEDISVDNLR